MSDNAPEQFRALLQSFCTEAGLAMQTNTQGIEFEAEGHVVLIVPDPRDPARMLIDVSVLALQDIQVDLLMALHRLNHAARLEHDWVIAINAADRLSLHTQREIASCQASDLQGLLSEGIERAQALQTLWQQLSESAKPSSSQAPLSVPDLSQMIRG